jgi:nitrate/nitrite-specific signal transduction histidine kinase
MTSYGDPARSGAQTACNETIARLNHGEFRLRVRDNGKGIDPEIPGGDGRVGHYGLPGMRERTELIGGKLAIWSEHNSGTEIELTIPAAGAYATSSRRSLWSEKVSGKEAVRRARG